MRNPNYWKTRVLNLKRKQRINRLLQKYGLIERREEINGVWGWNRRRNTVHALAHGANA